MKCLRRGSNIEDGRPAVAALWRRTWKIADLKPLMLRIFVVQNPHCIIGCAGKLIHGVGRITLAANAWRIRSVAAL
jgi:hypothetical protein